MGLRESGVWEATHGVPPTAPHLGVVKGTRPCHADDSELPIGP